MSAERLLKFIQDGKKKKINQGEEKTEIGFI